MPSFRPSRGAAVAAIALALAAPAVEAQTLSGSGCSWAPGTGLGAANASCARYTIQRTVAGGFLTFTISITNETPAGRGPQIFRTIFAYVPAGVTEAQVTNFTANPTGYALAGAPFNGEVWSQGTSLGNNQSIIDWTSSPGDAIGIGQTGTFSFRLPGTVDIIRLGVHAQRVGANGEGSQWIAFPAATTPIAPNVVPEPSTYALMATGLAGVMVMMRRRRRA